MRLYSLVPNPTAEISMYGNTSLNRPSALSHASSEYLISEPKGLLPTSSRVCSKLLKRGACVWESNRSVTSPRRTAKHCASAGPMRKKVWGLVGTHAIGPPGRCRG